MAKKTKKKNQKTAANKLPENMLPQNILPVGERVEENKNIYISQSVYKEIQKFTKNKTTNESGGMLVGTIIEEFGKTNIVISGFVEAKYSDATPTTLKFTHQTWEYVHKEIEKKHKGKKILGWIHTHPDFGIFLSEYDKFIHQNFFSEDYQIAYVVDPIQMIEGFYFWINGNIEKCKGFYIYDKTGTKITIDTTKEEPTERSGEPSKGGAKNILIAILCVAVVLLTFSNISFSSRLDQLETKQKKLETAYENRVDPMLYVLQQTIVAQNMQIEELTKILEEAGIIIEPETPETPDGNESGEENPEDAETGATEGESTDGE